VYPRASTQNLSSPGRTPRVRVALRSSWLPLFCSHPEKTCILSSLFTTLIDSASCKSFACRSLAPSKGEGSENTRDATGLLPAFTPQLSVFPRVTPLESTLTKNPPVSPLESTLTKSLDLKSHRIILLRKRVGEGPKPYPRPSSKVAHHSSLGTMSARAWTEPHRSRFPGHVHALLEFSAAMYSSEARHGHSR
jgi:hypothetical protein